MCRSGDKYILQVNQFRTICIQLKIGRSAQLNYFDGQSHARYTFRLTISIRLPILKLYLEPPEKTWDKQKPPFLRNKLEKWWN